MAGIGGSARRNPRGADFKFLSVGGGAPLFGLTSHTVSVDPASIAANTRAGTAVTVTGVKVGDLVLVSAPTALEAGLSVVGAVVTATDTVTLNLLNGTSGAIDGAARNWIFQVFHLS